MKKLFIFLLLGIFMLSFANAEWTTWDNWKSYDSETQTIKVRDLTGTIGEMKLVTPFNNKVPMGYQKVAVFNITLYEDYKDAFKDLQFYDNKDGMKETQRVYDWKYLTYKTVSIEDYHYDCDEQIEEGVPPDCIRISDGFHDEQEEVWKKLTSSTFKKGDVVTIGLFTDVKPGDQIDWIPTIFGKRLDEWAFWTEDMSAGLILYWSNNETTSPMTDASGYGSSGALIGGAVADAQGFLNGAVEFDGDNDYMNYSSGAIPLDNTDPWSVSLWFNSTTPSADRFLGFMGPNGNPTATLLKLQGSNLQMQVGPTAHALSQTINANEWYHVVFVFNGTHDNIYLNGTTYEKGWEVSAWDAGANSDFAIGVYPDRVYGNHGGNIDEIMVWNRSINTTEIQALHNGTGDDGEGLTLWDIDTVAPTIVLHSPANTTYTTNLLWLNFTNESVVDTWLFQNNTAGNQTLTVNRTIIALEGENNITLWANSTTGEFSSKIIFYTVDTQGPNVSIISPEDGVTYSSAQQWINLTYDSDDTDLVVYNWNGTNISYTPTLPTDIWEQMKMWKNGTGYSPNSEPNNISNLYANLTIPALYRTYPTTSIMANENFIYSITSNTSTGAEAGYLHQIYRANWTIAETLNLTYYSTSSPIIAGDGYIYFGDGQGKVWKVEEANVSVVNASFQTGNKISKAGVTDGDFVYMPSHDNIMYQIWKQNMTSFANYTTTSQILGMPAIANGYLYIGNNNNKFFQLDKNNISILISSYTTGGDVYWKPAVSSEFVYFVDYLNKNVYQANASNVSIIISQFVAAGNLHSPGVLCGDAFFQQDEAGNIYKLNASNISIQLDTVAAGGSITEAMSCSDNFVYASTRGVWDMEQYYTENLTLVGSYDLPGTDMAVSQTFANGLLFTGDNSPSIYVLGDYIDPQENLINFSEGLNTLSVWANDSSGNIVYNSSTFTIIPEKNIEFSWVSPANATNQSSTAFNLEWLSHSNNDSLLEIGTVYLYADDVLEYSNSSGINGTYTYTYTYNGGNWSRLEVAVFGNDSIWYNSSDILYVANWANFTAPTFSDRSPVNFFNTSSTTVDLGVNVSDEDNDMVNVTLQMEYLSGSSYINHGNTTNSSGLEEVFYNWTYNISSSPNWRWRVVACDLLTCNSSTYLNLTYDIVPPTITLSAPTIVQDFKQLTGIQDQLNWTVNDSRLDACWYSYNLTNTTVTCGDNTTTFNVNRSERTINFWANDTLGNTINASRNWTYKVVEDNITYDATTTSGALEDFVAYIYVDSGNSLSSVAFNYDGTTTIPVESTSGDLTILTVTDFVIPSVAVATNVTFNFSVVTTNPSNITLTSQNVTVSPVGMGNCTTYNHTLLNFTVVDEELQTLIGNATIQIAANLYSKDRTVNISNFTSNTNNTNPLALCIESQIPTGVTYSLDAVVKYFATGYSIEYYNIVNSSVTNGTDNNITLYDLNSSDATEFKITFKDSDFVIVEGALISVNRQYIPEAVFKTVELPITDSNGQTVAHLVEKDIVYNFIVTKGGQVLGTFNNLIAFCDDATIGSCFITLNAVQSAEQSFDYDSELGILSSFDYNSTSRELDFTFTTSDGTSKTIVLNGTKVDQLGNTSVCDETITSASATLTCTIPSSIGNDSIYVEIWVDGQPKLLEPVSAGQAVDLGTNGYFILFFMLISLVMMFSGTKSGVIVGVILAFVSGTLLFLFKGAIIGSVSSITWLVIAGVILLWKLNKEQQT